ncbi:hypothetical protein [Paracoccus haematequi]|uniref:hypothetical protein n=1 Tax=Paracoccus haematequi TaxID=2491866 RepID=UPI000F7F428A|nr:hypothetical protein [Paracoccus haematequi]
MSKISLWLLAVMSPVVAAAPSVAFSQECPSGFTLLGQAYDEDSKVNAEAKVEAFPPALVKFPPHFKLDRSIVQQGGKWAGGSASAVMSDGNVPEGILILAGGTEGGAKGWAVGPAKLVVLQEADDEIIQRGLEIGLYCHTGSGEADKAGHLSCNVHANICGKSK